MPSIVNTENQTEITSIAVETDSSIETLAFENEVTLDEVERQQRLAGKRIPTTFDYNTIGPLRNEAKEKLSKIRPLNLDQAKRISGITPADLALVLAHMESKRKS